MDVTDTLDQYAQLEAALDKALAKASRKAKEQAKEQLENLRDTIDELTNMFEQYLAGLRVPDWLQWLF